MILLMLIGSLAGCFKTVSGLYDDVIDIFEDGANDDDECIESYIEERADIAADMCRIARKNLYSSEDDKLISELSDAAGALSTALDAEDIADIKEKMCADRRYEQRIQRNEISRRYIIKG